MRVAQTDEKAIAQNNDTPIAQTDRKAEAQTDKEGTANQAKGDSTYLLTSQRIFVKGSPPPPKTFSFLNISQHISNYSNQSL